MAPNIKITVDALIADAEREIENLDVADAVKLHGRDDVVFVDIRDIRELARDGRNSGRISLSARHTRILDRSAKQVPQAGICAGQALCALLRRRRALGARDPDGAAHGPAAGRPYPRRLRRLEGHRRAGGDGYQEGMNRGT